MCIFHGQVVTLAFSCVIRAAFFKVNNCIVVTISWEALKSLLPTELNSGENAKVFFTFRIESTNKNGCNTFALKYTWICYNQPRKVAYAVLSSVALLQCVQTIFGPKSFIFKQIELHLF